MKRFERALNKSKYCSVNTNPAYWCLRGSAEASIVCGIAKEASRAADVTEPHPHLPCGASAKSTDSARGWSQIFWGENPPASISGGSSLRGRKMFLLVTQRRALVNPSNGRG